LRLGGLRCLQALASSPSGRILAAVEMDSRTLAGGDVEDTVYLWEVHSGQEVRRIGAQQGHVLSLAFTADGRTLATGGGESTILLWDLTGSVSGGKVKPVAPLTAVELDGLWADLAGDAATADRALWTLAKAPQQS